MNSQEFKKNICRICLDDSVVLDWNATIYGHYDTTYKDCFYKYTRLESIASDAFSPMLCQICLDSLYNVHTFILKALESQKYFQETSVASSQFDHSITFTDDVKYTPAEFETVLVEKLEVKNIIHDNFVYEHSDEKLIIKPVKGKVENYSKRCRTDTKRTEKQKKCISRIEKSWSDKKGNKSENNLTQALGNEITEERKKGQMIELDELLCDNIKRYGGQSDSKVKKKYKERKKPRMCSICSKILNNKRAVEMHEKTHMENRERKETCKICGLKFYDKNNLYSHKRIHKENREKIHKCEFCDKAFYNKGGLNIHRRIHLGQMVPCSLCSKQFFRQIDLDRHMSSHSATAINSEMKKRSRYFVRCKHCDKSILSTSFKSHTAAHLNEPLMKCSICSKEYFRRGSCVHHIKKAHQKTNEEYNNFIIIYKKNRISHLFLEQKADIQFTDE